MLTAAGCKSRRERLWASVPETVEWILVTNPRHVNYLCGFSVNPLSFSAGERAMLLLERDDSATLLLTILRAVPPRASRSSPTKSSPRGMTTKRLSAIVPARSFLLSAPTSTS